MLKRSLLILAPIVAISSCAQQPPMGNSIQASPQINHTTPKSMDDKLNKTEDEWKNILSREQYEVLRQKSTEQPFSGKFENFYGNGTYVCAACGNELFSSGTKFDAGCGWPSFYEALDKSKIIEHPDSSHGMIRTEILCARCGGHLGHVFNDGPQPTGLRYCVNSISLDFKEKK